MSRERQLSELKQEIQFLGQEKQQCIDGITYSLLISDWLHVKKCACRLVEIEGLLNAKGEQLLVVSAAFAEEQRQAILEIV